MKKIYLSGAISHDPNFKSKFLKAELELKKEYIVISPAYIDITGKDYTAIIKECLDMQNDCDITYFLSDYRESNGAMMELNHSLAIGQLQLFEKPIDLTGILSNVCYVEGVSLKAIKSKSREHTLVHARQIYCKLARDRTSKTLTEIAKLVNIDHSSVSNGLKACRNEYHFTLQEKLKKYE